MVRRAIFMVRRFFLKGFAFIAITNFEKRNMTFLLQPAEIPGNGNIYRLSIGKKQETDAAETEYQAPPSWKQLADQAIMFCKDESICLSYLAEQGGIRRGDNTQYRYWWPDEVKKYIASHNFKK